MYSTMLQCTVQHYAAVYCTALYCSVQLQYYAAVYCTAPCCSVLYSTILQCAVMLQCTVQYFTAVCRQVSPHGEVRLQEGPEVAAAGRQVGGWHIIAAV